MASHFAPLQENSHDRSAILLVAPSYPPYNKGGGGIFYENIANKLAERGHQVTLVAGYPGKKFKSEMTEHGINIVWVPLISFFVRKYPGLQEYGPTSLINLIKLKRILNRKYNVVHLLAFGHIFIDCVNLLLRSNKKVVTIHGLPHPLKNHGFSSLLSNGFYSLYKKTLGSYTLASCKKITVPSNFVARDCATEGIPQNRLNILPNGIDIELYHPVMSGDFEREYNILPEEIVILSITRISWMKGLQYGIESMLEVQKQTTRPVKYIIAGSVDSPDYFIDLEKLVRRLGLENKVIFAGYFNFQKKLAALSRADLFLVTSVHETFGHATLEAMAMGKPIVGSNVEGLKDLLDDDAALLVDPINPTKISDAILKIINDSTVRKMLSGNAKAKANKYTWEEVVSQLELLYESIESRA